MTNSSGLNELNEDTILWQRKEKKHKEQPEKEMFLGKSRN